ncbi:hypothetical protein SAMN02745121_08767 [Nannocystis exedens]|uniref:Uncharacterized protein n=2 Tax=Nannocystis exedens TaxID=54 RepID=A0A1I2IMQ2_9BACT|nr:hypothetical protein NAEX_02326 [Nannocystis exedens]SFF42317.1 hypothetical protein SAMN02745121_08767 [Nannocystis exedens]
MESATESATGMSETDGPTSGGPDTGGVSQVSCERYLNCIAATDPAALPAAQMGFGPDAPCWQGSPETAEQCLNACQTGLKSAHMVYPDEPACFLCDDDTDCGAEEQCQAGTCKFVGCGDGIVSDDEVCDGPSCPDCHAPGLCNPLSHAGCEASEQCLRIENEFQCANMPNAPGYHEECTYDVACGAGLVCTIFDPVCGECCNKLCRTDGTANCDCSPFDPPYEYVGVCQSE